MNIIELFVWITNLFGIMGAYEVSKNKCNTNLRKVNCLFAVQNAYSIFYFLFTMQYAYAILQTVFIIFSIKGIIENKPTKSPKISSYQVESKIISN